MEKNKNRETVKIPHRGGTGQNMCVLPSADQYMVGILWYQDIYGGSIRNKSVEKKLEIEWRYDIRRGWRKTVINRVEKKIVQKLHF